MEDNLTNITRIFREVLNNNTLDLKPTDTPHTVGGWDSLTHARILTEIEDFCSIEFKLKELAGIRSIADILSLIDAKQNAGS